MNAAYARLLANGRRDGKGGLSQRSVHHCHRILFQALGQAVKWKLLKSNPMLAVDAPAVAAVEMTTLTDDQLATALSAMQETRFLVPFLLGVMCGLRRGKICALKWKYVDLERGTLQVTASARQIKTEVTYKRPKDGKAGRSVELPPLVVEELRAHRRRQIEEQLKLGIRLGADSFVVAQPDGAPLKPSSLTNEWRRLSVKHRLPRIRFHDLRHTHASQLLASGVHPKVAQERLGHSTIAITLDLYSHMMPNTQADAAVAVDNRLRAAISKRAKDGS